MGNSKFTRSVSLAVSLAIVLVYFTPLNTLNLVNFEWANRAFYPLKSANAIHAILNAYCLLGLAFIYRMKGRDLLLSYIIAILAPSSLLVNTVGFSGVIYAGLGFFTRHAETKTKYISFILLSFLITFFLPSCNYLLHAYCYLAGYVVSLLFAHEEDE